MLLPTCVVYGVPSRKRKLKKKMQECDMQTWLGVRCEHTSNTYWYLILNVE